jgi:selT/selW/selH-like putative selenoprotein
LAGKLKKNFEIEASLIEGAGGIFDVKLNDELVYCKHETGKFPDEEDLIAALRDRLT